MTPLRCWGVGLYGFGRFQESFGYDFNGTVLVCGGEADGTVLVVDPVEPTESELAGIRSLGSRFIVILLNADHERDSFAVGKALGAPVYVPRADLGLVRQDGVIPYDDGHVFPGGFVAVGLAGHKTAGETALIHEGRQILVVGDAVIGDPVTGLRLVPRARVPDVNLALSELARLAERRFEGLFLSDGFIVPQGGRRALASFLARSRSEP